MQPLPHRYRESQFRRYEHFIARAVSTAPAAILCDPKLFNIAATTFAARLRDAIKSYHDNNWPSSTISRPAFDILYPSLTVAHRADGTVLLGDRNAIRGYQSIGNPAPIVPEASSIVTISVIHLTAAELIMQLSHRRLLAPRLILTGLTEVDVDTYQQKYDIALDRNEDGTYTLI